MAYAFSMQPASKADVSSGLSAPRALTTGDLGHFLSVPALRAGYQWLLLP